MSIFPIGPFEAADMGPSLRWGDDLVILQPENPKRRSVNPVAFRQEGLAYILRGSTTVRIAAPGADIVPSAWSTPVRPMRAPSQGRMPILPSAIDRSASSIS